MTQRTSCSCSEPGYCHRHKMAKGRQQWLACQRIQDLFDQWESQVNDPNFLAQPPPAAQLPRCIHRGLDELESVKCELCGNREILVPVYACSLHQRCTERRFGNSSDLSRNLAACTSCADYDATNNLTESI